MKIENAVVLITGANRGIGLAFARELLARGARKVYAAARDPATVTLPGVQALRLDVTQPDEIAAAVQAQQDAIAALGPLPSGARIKAEPVKTVPVMVTDKTSNQTKAVDSFESFDLDIPLSMKGTPGYDKAIASLSAFAVKKADERGASNIDRAMTAADARANKFVPETNVAKTPKGNPVTVTKVINNATQKGVERVTVRVRKLEPTAVS